MTERNNVFIHGSSKLHFLVIW